MARSVPDNHMVLALEIFNLLVKQPMIRRLTRKENQGQYCRGSVPADPVMNVPAGRTIDLFLHCH